MGPTEALRAAVRDVADFPRPGILFKDITPILGNGTLLRTAMDCLVADCIDQDIRKIVGIDARGFLFGATVADRLGIGFVPIRKRGKLPWKTETLAYKLEYGEAEMEVHVDAFEPGERVSLIDDLLATGGTAAATVGLVRGLGAHVVGVQFLIELLALNGRDKLKGEHVGAVLAY